MTLPSVKNSRRNQLARQVADALFGGKLRIAVSGGEAASIQTPQRTLSSLAFPPSRILGLSPPSPLPAIEISGGPEVSLLLTGIPDRVYTRTRDILLSGIKQGGRFILQEGNNLPPRCPACEPRSTLRGRAGARRIRLTTTRRRKDW